MVARIGAGGMCCMTSANGGAPADVMVPMKPETVPATTTLGAVGSSRQPSKLSATAARIDTENSTASGPCASHAMVSTAACFTALMMTISVLGRTESAVAGASWGLMMPFAMIGGGMIPLIAMPPWLVTASAVSPFKWAITAIEGAVWRDFGLADMVLPCAVLIATGALFAGIGIAVFRRVDG